MGSQNVEPDFIPPVDWPPLQGDIDLDLHDLPHASSATEVCVLIELCGVLNFFC
jgi:hypothetical protein